MTRVVIITEIIAPYRIPVFNALAQEDGIELHVIFLAETDPTQRHWPIYRSEIRFSYEVLPSWRRRLRRWSVLLNRGVYSALQRSSPDLVICGGYNYVASWSALRWARRHRTPFFLWVESTARDLRSYHGLKESLKTRFLRNCDGFLVPGKSSLQYLTGYGVPHEAIFTAPNAVDNPFFMREAAAVRENADRYRRSLGMPPRFFLFAGRIVAEKGIFDLLQAYSALPARRRAEVGLVYVGRGPVRGKLARRAFGINPGSVHIADFAQREELAAFYALADALVFPTHTDPWGLVVNEAMACGIPVICSSAAGSSADLVEDGWNGYVIRSGDVRGLTSRMDELTGDASLRERMGRHSSERVSRFSAACWAAGVLQAIHSTAPHRSAWLQNSSVPALEQ